MLPTLVSANNRINQVSFYAPSTPTFEIRKNMRFLIITMVIDKLVNLILTGEGKWRLTINYVLGN